LSFGPYGTKTIVGVRDVPALPAKRLGLDDRAIDDRLALLKFPLPCAESDHVLTRACNLFVGGSRIRDIRNLRASDAILKLPGADRIPDPAAAGGFLRRFDQPDPEALRSAVDAARVKVWKKMSRRSRRRATVDIASHIKEAYAERKEGADFSYTRKWPHRRAAQFIWATDKLRRMPLL